MSWYRWLACMLCLAALDGVWIFLLLAFTGFVAGLGGSPLAFTACEAVVVAVALGAAAGDLLPPGWRAARGLLAPAVGGLAMWAALVAAGAGVGAGHRAVVAVACVALAHAGARRARGAVTSARVAASFRRGIVVFVAVLALEAAGRLDLGADRVLVPFFACALLGMVLGQAPDRGARLRAWLAAIAAIAVVMALAGVVLAGVAVALVRGGAGMLRDGWLAFAIAADRSVRATLAELFEDGTGTGLDLHGIAAHPSDALVVTVLALGGALMIWGTARMLRARKEETPRIVLDLAGEEREALDSGETRGLLRWFERLLSRWPGRRGTATPPLPPVEGIRDVALLYYRMLDLARARHVTLDPSQTPFERRDSLHRALPPAAVDALTGRFVAACYGDEPSPPATVKALARALDDATR